MAVIEKEIKIKIGKAEIIWGGMFIIALLTTLGLSQGQQAGGEIGQIATLLSRQDCVRGPLITLWVATILVPAVAMSVKGVTAAARYGDKQGLPDYVANYVNMKD